MKKASIGIYSFVNTVTGVRYIGQSRNLENRRKEHVRSLKRGDHHSKYFQRSTEEHGFDVFVYSILEYCDHEILTIREQFWLDFYKPSGLYNSAPVADSNHGVVWSEEARAKRSADQIGRTHSEESKRKIGDSHRGKILSAEQSAALKASWRGKSHTDESRAKMSASRKGVKFSADHIANMNVCKIGRKHSPESIEKMRAAKIGRKHTEEAKSRISAAGVGRIRPPESNKKSIETRMRNKALKDAALAA